jgi:hypothetical protein
MNGVALCSESLVRRPVAATIYLTFTRLRRSLPSAHGSEVSDHGRARKLIPALPAAIGSDS